MSAACSCSRQSITEAMIGTMVSGRGGKGRRGDERGRPDGKEQEKQRKGGGREGKSMAKMDRSSDCIFQERSSYTDRNYKLGGGR